MAVSRDIDAAPPAELLFALKSLQHQLGNAVGAVLSHVTLIGQSAAGGPDAQTLDRLSLASDQTLAVAKSLRIVLDGYEPARRPLPATLFLSQLRTIVEALLNRVVPLHTAADESLAVAVPNAPALLTCIIFTERNWLRSAGEISLDARSASADGAVRLSITPAGANASKRGNVESQLPPEVLSRVHHAGLRIASPPDRLEILMESETR